MSIQSTQSKIYPLVPLRDVIVFPKVVLPLRVGREQSVNALVHSNLQSTKIVTVLQKDPNRDSISKDDLYEVGVLVDVLQVIKSQDNIAKIVSIGMERVKIKSLLDRGDFLQAEIEPYPYIDKDAIPESQISVLSKMLMDKLSQYTHLSDKDNIDINVDIDSKYVYEKLSLLSNTILSSLEISLATKQQLLEEQSLVVKCEKLCVLLEQSITVLEADKKIQAHIESQLSDSHRKVYLTEQLKAIQKELGYTNVQGEENVIKKDLEELYNKIQTTKLPNDSYKKVNEEFEKLKLTNPLTQEAGVIRGYINWLLDIPWAANPTKDISMSDCEKILDKYHYGLAEIKDRILEYIAVRRRTKQVHGNVLCLVGPPGVGKTSLAKSIAEATGREYVKIALGGVRDESEMRGHRKTYIGSMPGKIIQSMKKVTGNNPLILLDEIDKMSSDFRGDPASALLEILDPEQNKTFNDHYLEVNYDLSNVMFIATANSHNIPLPLLDRMEVITVSGYTESEKISIAQTHLIPKLFEEHALKTKELNISKTLLQHVIRHYTYEAGVRGLKRVLSKLMRKSVRRLESEKELEKVIVNNKNVSDMLGPIKFDYTRKEKSNLVGIANGLAYTTLGGDILQIEAILIPGGDGKIKYTGKLGQVMSESVEAAFSYVRSKLSKFGGDSKLLKSHNIHLHVPEGATPKDGPSAGITISLAIASLLSSQKIRSDIAMTGEITLRGRVLPIGGLKEKLLAALRSNMKTVLIPKENEKDLVNIPDEVKDNLEIIPVESFEDVLKYAIVQKTKTNIQKD